MTDASFLLRGNSSQLQSSRPMYGPLPRVCICGERTRGAQLSHQHTRRVQVDKVDYSRFCSFTLSIALTMCDKRIEGCKTAPNEGIHALDIELSALLKWSKSRQPKNEVHIGVAKTNYQRPTASESVVKHHDIALNTEINLSEKPACIFTLYLINNC
jgi:hypothetical protein